jgi:hypothetical protein
MASDAGADNSAPAGLFDPHQCTFGASMLFAIDRCRNVGRHRTRRNGFAAFLNIKRKATKVRIKSLIK